jgi:hypothetical protein
MGKKMLQESKYLQVLCLAILLAACAGEGPGEGGLDTELSATEEAGDNTETDDTTDTDTELEDDSDTETDDAGTQTDDESTDDADDETDTTDDTTPGDADDTEPSDDPEDEYTGHDLNGKWEGSYTCSQGFTRLTLQVTHNFESHWLDAVFAFYADDSNPDVPTGRYSMIGSYDPDSGNVDLNEAAWIEQPGGYVMVSLDGFINEESTSITGTVDNFGCTVFTVVRGN